MWLYSQALPGCKLLPGKVHAAALLLDGLHSCFEEALLFSRCGEWVGQKEAGEFLAPELGCFVVQLFVCPTLCVLCG